MRSLSPGLCPMVKSSERWRGHLSSNPRSSSSSSVRTHTQCMPKKLRARWFLRAAWVTCERHVGGGHTALRRHATSWRRTILVTAKTQHLCFLSGEGCGERREGRQRKLLDLYRKFRIHVYWVFRRFDGVGISPIFQITKLRFKELNF